ncbi:MAG: hypothetical protein H0U03_13080, partial [Actinobacteria bacterium]|nr:hypothetical protein [Actinomycetota bacterium]
MTEHADAPMVERLRALGAEEGGGDWADVLTRARQLEPKPGRTRRAWVVALAVSVGLALVAGPALGLHEPVLRFFEGEPAPEQVRRAFESLDDQAPTPEWRPGVLEGQTRIVMKAYFADKWQTLSVGPTKYGGLCMQWSQSGGGCDRLGTVPLSITYGVSRPFLLPEGRPRRPRDVPIDYLNGFAHSKWVHEVEIRYEDGEVVRPRVV